MKFPNSTRVILLVDDEQMVRTVLRVALEMHGYDVLEASDGIQALAIFHEHEAEIALLLTDVIMPEIGGVELARQVVSKRPDIAVLFISGFCDELPNELSRHFCIPKPFLPSEIIERVATMVPIVREMKTESCAERQKLAQSVAAAIRQTYIARHALQAAKNAKSADTVQSSIALQRARSKHREAAQAHDKHVEEHRCGLLR